MSQLRSKLCEIEVLCFLDVERNDGFLPEAACMSKPDSFECFVDSKPSYTVTTLPNSQNSGLGLVRGNFGTPFEEGCVDIRSWSANAMQAPAPQQVYKRSL